MTRGFTVPCEPTAIVLYGHREKFASLRRHINDDDRGVMASLLTYARYRILRGWRIRQSVAYNGIGGWTLRPLMAPRGFAEIEGLSDGPQGDLAPRSRHLAAAVRPAGRDGVYRARRKGTLR